MKGRNAYLKAAAMSVIAFGIMIECGQVKDTPNEYEYYICMLQYTNVCAALYVSAYAIHISW